MNKFKTFGLVLMISPLLLVFYASQPGTPLSILSGGTGYVGEPFNFRWVTDTSAGLGANFKCPTNYPRYRADIMLYKPGSNMPYPSTIIHNLVPSGMSYNSWSYLFDYEFTPDVAGDWQIKFQGKCLKESSTDYVLAGEEWKTFHIYEKVSNPSPSPPSSPNPPTTECSPGEVNKTCSGSNAIVKTCDNSGSWVTATQYCQYGCNDGACMSCSPNDVRKTCEGSTLVTSVCSNTGSWERSNTQECQNGCSNGACLTDPIEAQQNETQNTSLEINVTNQEEQANASSNESTSTIIENKEQEISSYSLRFWLEKDDIYKGVKNMTVLMSSGLFLAGLFLYLKGGRK